LTLPISCDIIYLEDVVVVKLLSGIGTEILMVRGFDIKHSSFALDKSELDDYFYFTPNKNYLSNKASDGTLLGMFWGQSVAEDSNNYYPDTKAMRILLGL